MTIFLYRCPHTGLKVQAWTADDPTPEGDAIYVSVTCTACARLHLVDPKTGRVLGTGDDKDPTSPLPMVSAAFK